MNIGSVNPLTGGTSARPEREDLDRLLWRGQLERLNETDDHRIVRPEPAVREHEVARPPVRVVKRREGTKQRRRGRGQANICEAIAVIAAVRVGMMRRLEHPAV